MITNKNSKISSFEKLGILKGEKNIVNSWKLEKLFSDNWKDT